MSKWLHDDSCISHLSFTDSFWFEVMILVFVCVLYWLMSWLTCRAACNQVPAVCYVCEALTPFLPALSTEPLFDLAEIGPSQEPYHKRGSVIHRSLKLKNYPEERKEHDRILHELFFSQWYLLGWAKHRLVSGGHLEREMNQLALSENTSGLFLLVFWGHSMGWSNLSLIVQCVWRDFQDLVYVSA